jgi:hypothetical protein
MVAFTASSSWMSHLHDSATSATGGEPTIESISASVSSQPPRDRTTTLAPSSTKRHAIAWPKPRLAPETMHTLPESRGSRDILVAIATATGAPALIF